MASVFAQLPKPLPVALDDTQKACPEADVCGKIPVNLRPVGLGSGTASAVTPVFFGGPSYWTGGILWFFARMAAFPDLYPGPSKGGMG